MAGYDFSADLSGNGFDASAEFCCGEKEKGPTYPQFANHPVIIKAPYFYSDYL